MLSLLLIPLNLTSEKMCFIETGDRDACHISHSCAIQLRTENRLVREVTELGWWLFEDNPAAVV